MKKSVYHSLYQVFLSLSNHFNNRFFVKCKILLGTTLIVLTSSCSKDEDDEPELMCYDPAPPKETVEINPLPPSSLVETVRFIEEK